MFPSANANFSSPGAATAFQNDISTVMLDSGDWLLRFHSSIRFSPKPSSNLAQPSISH